MRHIHSRQPLFVLIMILVLGGWSASASGQVDPALVDLRDRLVETSGEEYIAVRDAALSLPEDRLKDLLDLLRDSPDYSLEHVLSLILEARANHPKEAARFDRDFQNMLDNPDIGRHGGPIYHPWTNLEVEAVHPFVYEVLIKRVELPGQVRTGVRGMTFIPNPDNIPFILYLAENHSPGAFYDRVSATEGFPEERAWLRPLALKMYKEYRDSGEVASAGVISMFRGFGTPEDLEILRQIREYERKLMQEQGIVIGDRDEVGKRWYDATSAYRRKHAELGRAEREGAPNEVIRAHRQQLVEAEAVAREAVRQHYGNMLWEQIEEYIDRLETKLEPDRRRESQGARS